MAFGMDPSVGLPAKTVAKTYVEAVDGDRTGTVFEPAAPT